MNRTPDRADALADAFGLASLIRLHLVSFAAGLALLGFSLLAEPEQWRSSTYDAILFRLFTPTHLGAAMLGLALLKGAAFIWYPRLLSWALVSGSVLFTWLCIACAAVYISGEVNPMAPFAAVASAWLVIEHLAVAGLVYRDREARRALRRVEPPPAA